MTNRLVDICEFVFRIDYDIISDTTKARRYGFHEVLEPKPCSTDVHELREQRYIP